MNAKKIALRFKRIDRAKQAREMKRIGMTTMQIASRLGCSYTTIESDLKKGVELTPISRNTWKLSSVIKPSRPGKYWVTFKEGGNDQFICDLDTILESPSMMGMYWCGPITPPKWNAAEIALERKLREVTK